MNKNKKIKNWLIYGGISLVTISLLFAFSFKQAQGQDQGGGNEINQSSQNIQQSQKDDFQCEVENVVFDPAGMQDKFDTNEADWFADGKPPSLNITVTFKPEKCKNPEEEICLDIVGPEYSYPQALFDKVNYRLCFYPRDATNDTFLKEVSLRYRVGENNVGTRNSGSPEAIARLVARILREKGQQSSLFYHFDSFSNQEFISSARDPFRYFTYSYQIATPDLTILKTTQDTPYTYIKDGASITATIEGGNYNLTLAKNPNGFLAFNCDGACDENWQPLEITLTFQKNDGSTFKVLLLKNNGTELTTDAQKYFNEESFKTSAEQAKVTTETSKQIEENLYEDTICGISILGGKGTIIPGCFPVAFLEIITKLLNLLAYLAAKILDFFVHYSIDSENYRIPYISFGWKVFRDFINIFFIFILLYIAINVVLGLKEAQKKLLVNLIIVVLLINFSLFISRVIVDVGNSFANVIYYSMEVKEKGTLEYPALTEIIVDRFDPYHIYTDLSPEIKATWWLYCVLLIALIALNIIIFTTFLSIAIFFLGRTVGIWIAMITAPLAFFTLALPSKIKEATFKDYEFTKWLSNLVNMAIMPVIFLFFLYLIIKLGNPTALKQTYHLQANASDLIFAQQIGVQAIGGNEKNVLTSLLQVILPFMIIVALIKIAKTQAQKLAGEVAAQIKEMAGKAITTAALLAVPAAGMAARGFIGAAGGVTKAAGKGMEYLGRKRLFGEKISKGLEKMGAKTKAVGVGVSKAPGKVGKFMEETRVGQVLKGTGKVAGKVFEWGAEKMGIGLEKIPTGLAKAGKTFTKVAPLVSEYAKKIGLSEEMASRIAHNLGKYDYRTAQEEKEWITKEKKYKMEKIKKNLSNKSDEYTKEKSRRKRERYEQKIGKLIENYLKNHPDEQKEIEEKAKELALKEKSRLEAEANTEGSDLNNEIKNKAYKIWKERKEAGQPDADNELKNWGLAKEKVIEEKVDNFLKSQKEILSRKKAEEIFPPPKVYETTAEKNMDVLKKAFEKYSQKEDRVSQTVAKEIQSIVFQKENLSLKLDKKEKELNQINEVINQFKNELQQQDKESSVENILNLGKEKIQDLKTQELEIKEKIKEAQMAKNFKEVIRLSREKNEIEKKIKVYEDPFGTKLSVEEEISKIKEDQGKLL